MKRYLLLLCTMSALSMTAWTQVPVKPAAASTVKPVLNPSTTPVLKNAPTMITGAQSISGVIPAEGPRATAITISGTKFGGVQSDVQVKINNVSAIITGVSDNQITCVVPDRCGSGAVSVAVKGKWTSGSYFQYDWAANISTFAPTAGSAIRIDQPGGLARDAAGYIYVADSKANKIFKVNNFGEVSLLAGSGTRGFADGQGEAAQFSTPGAVAVDGSGNVYVTDYLNYRVRKITPSGMVSTLAGSGKQGYADGAGATAQFAYIRAISTDATGVLYVAEHNDPNDVSYMPSRIRKIARDGAVSTPTGQANNLPSAYGIVIDPSGAIYTADYTAHCIRKITLQ